eukprot:497179-Rhodomonas_salina.3
MHAFVHSRNARFSGDANTSGHCAGNVDAGRGSGTSRPPPTPYALPTRCPVLTWAMMLPGTDNTSTRGRRENYYAHVVPGTRFLVVDFGGYLAVMAPAARCLRQRLFASGMGTDDGSRIDIKDGSSEHRGGDRGVSVGSGVWVR